MEKTIQSMGLAPYVSPSVKVVTLHASHSVFKVSYGEQGQAGHDGEYEEGDDL